MCDTPELPLGNDFEVGINVSAFDPLEKEVLAQEGRSVTALIAATPTGAAIHASLSIALADLQDGDYHGVIQGADIDTHLTAYLGQEVWVRITSGSSDLTGAVKHVVVNPRYLA